MLITRSFSMPSTTSTTFAALVTLGAATCCTGALAGELYTKLGAPGLMLGWAQPLNSQFGLRVDVATLGNRTAQRTEEGIRYDAALKLTRTALLADWFPMSGGFRFTGGVTANQYRLDLAASGAGGTLTIGNTTYTTTAADRFSVKVGYPSSTPYLGLGWGHHAASGWRFSFDLGGMVGKASVSYSLTGPLAQRVSQDDIDAELAELRSGVGKVKAVPQLSVGFGYSF